MKISRVDSYLEEEITDIDIFVGVMGREPRCSYLPQKIYKTKVAKECHLIKYTQFDQYEVDGQFILHGPIEKSDTQSNPIWEIFQQILNTDKKEFNVLIDYSSMTRSWYANFLFSCCELHIDKIINLYFGYTIASFNSPATGISYKVDRMYNYLHFNAPNRPTALIIGLGYEKDQAYSLMGYFNVGPDDVYLFRTDKRTNEDYYQEVTKQNAELIKAVPDNHIFEYSLDDIISANKLLLDLCHELTFSNRVIIVPCGPKPFTLISLLTSIRNDSVDIWRASNHTDSYYHEKESSEKVIYTHIKMVSD